MDRWRDRTARHDAACQARRLPDLAGSARKPDGPPPQLAAMMAPPSGPAPPPMPHLLPLLPLSDPLPAHRLACRLLSTLMGSLLACWLLLLCQPEAQAAAVATGTWEHGLAAYVAPKYPRGYRHFD